MFKIRIRIQSTTQLFIVVYGSSIRPHINFYINVMIESWCKNMNSSNLIRMKNPDPDQQTIIPSWYWGYHKATHQFSLQNVELIWSYKSLKTWSWLSGSGLSPKVIRLVTGQISSKSANTCSSHVIHTQINKIQQNHAGKNKMAEILIRIQNGDLDFCDIINAYIYLTIINTADHTKFHWNQYNESSISKY